MGNKFKMNEIIGATLMLTSFVILYVFKSLKLVH